MAIRRLNSKERFAIRLDIDIWQLATMYAIRSGALSRSDLSPKLAKASLSRHISRELQLRHLIRMDIDKLPRLTWAGEAILEAIEVGSRSKRRRGAQSVVPFSEVRKVLPA